MDGTITICMGSSCHSRGNRQHLTTIQAYLTRHGYADRVDLRGSHCENRCSEGPVLRINETEYLHMDPGVLLDLLEEHFPPAPEGEAQP